MHAAAVDTDRRAEQIRKLTAITRALTYSTSLESILGLAVERASDLLETPQAVLMLQDPDGLLRIRAAHGVPADLIDRFTESFDEGLIRRLQKLLGELQPEAFLAVPLVARGNVIGMLAVVREPGEAPTEYDEWLLSAIGDHVAVALENARLTESIRQEVQYHREEARDAADSRERALGTMAHELRTPLHAIESYAELLELAVMGPVTDRQREALGRIRMSGRHLLSILDNVLDMARLNAGVLRCHPVRIEAVRVMKEATQLVLPSATDKGQSLSIEAPAQAWVRADAARLRQVITNILGNAIKYTPDDGAIEVTTSASSRDGRDWCEIAITDSGPGIDPGEIEHIFEPYYRVAATESEAGSGLGLSIANELIRQMGGSLEVASEPGAGSTFTVRLLSWRDPSDRPSS